jgi:hypothetical protein
VTLRLICPLLLLTAACVPSHGLTLNVAPGGKLASLAAARDAVRAAKAAGALTAPVRVVIADGVYPVAEPVLFTPEDSGTAAAPIRYEAAPGAHPVFSAGVELPPFTAQADGTWIVDLPEVRAGRQWFEQLYVDGRRATRAVLPKKEWFYTVRRVSEGDARRSVEVDPADLGALKGLTAAQLKDVCFVAYFSWESARLPLASVDLAKGLVTCGGPAAWGLNEFGGTTRQRYQLENVPGSATEPGEWTLGRDGKLVYRPLPGQDMAKTRAVAPVSPAFLRVKGDAALGMTVEHLSFRGLSFRHAAYVLPPTGHSDGQAEVTVGATIELDGARDVSFEDCEVAHIGTWAFWFRTGCRDCAVRRSWLHDLGAGGVKIGTGWEMDNPDDVRLTRGITVDNNIMVAGGRIHPGCHGVWIGNSSDNAVTHNDIGDFFYTAISAGWRWGYAPSVAKRNKIEFNRLHHLGWGVLSDMGGVYTLGPSAGTTIRGNFISDVMDYGWYGRGGWGLYNDEGSSDIVMENNLVVRTDTGGYHLHYGKDLVIRNNIFADSRDFQLQHSRNEDHHQFDFTHNIVWYRTGELFNGSWVQKSINLDHNLYWNASGRPVTFGGLSFSDWTGKGVDHDSSLGDPLFVDPDHDDWHLKPGSKALAMGFQPFDYTQAGVYGDAAWVALAKEPTYPPMVRPAAPPPPPPMQLDVSFAGAAIGSRPPGATAYVEGKGDSIGVSDEVTAPAGGRCLRIVDAPGLEHIWDPHFFWNPNHNGGITTCSFDMRVGAGVIMYTEWRDDHNPYRVGPSIWVKDGKLLFGGQPLLDFPQDQWVHLVIKCGLGAASTGKFDLTVTLPGAAPKVFAGLSNGSTDWRTLQWLGFSSMADAKTVYYLANFHLENAK